MMRVKLVTLHDEKYAAMGKVSSAIMEDYCRARGYEFKCYTHLPDPSRNAVWNKTRIIQQELNGCDWLLWMDADSFPVNKEKGIESMMMPGKDIIVSTDDAGICFGIFWVKNSSWSQQFFQTLWFVGQMDYEYAKRYHVAPQHDQVSVISLMQNFPAIDGRIWPVAKEVVCNPRSRFNPDAFAVHYWASDTKRFSHADIIRKMTLFKERGWCPQVHKDVPSQSSFIRKALMSEESFDIGVRLKDCDYQIVHVNITTAAERFLNLWEYESSVLQSEQKGLNVLMEHATQVGNFYELRGIRIKIIL